MVKLEENYFSDTLKWTIIIGSVGIGGYLWFMNSYLWVIIILVLVTLVSVSTKYSIVIDTEQKLITDSFYLLWFKTQSEKFNFNTVQGIRLDKQRHSYNANTRSRDRKADFNEYIATLEYDQHKSIELARNTEYQAVAEKMIQVADQLHCSINRTF
jgi:hypothetical protein